MDSESGPLSSGISIISSQRKPFLGMTKDTWKRYITLAKHIMYETKLRSDILCECTNVLEMITSNMGPSHATPQYVLQELTTCLKEKEMHRIAAHLLKERLQLYEKLKLFKHSVKTSKLLAGVYCSQGTDKSIEEGKNLYDEVLQKELQLLGKSSLDVGITLQQLGMLSFHQNSFEEAEEFLLKAMIVYIENIKKFDVKPHMETTTCIISSLYEQWKPGMDSLYESILSECVENEELVADFFFSLGFPIQSKEERINDRYDVALKIFGGSDVVKVTHSLLMLATLCSKKKLYKEAESLSLKLLKRCRKERVHSIELQAIYFNYCMKLYSKKFYEASECVEQLLKVSEDCFKCSYLTKEEKTVVSEKLARYGHLMLTRQRQFSSAEKILEVALQQAEQNLHTIAICHILVDLTQVYYNLKKFSLIDKIRERIIHLMQELDDSEMSRLVEMLERLVRLYRSWNRYDVVNNLLKQWPHCCLKEGTLICAKYYCYLAIVACEEKRKDYDKGYKYCQIAKEIIMKLISSSEWLQMDIEEVLWVFTTISWLLNKMKNVQEAITMNLQAFSVAKQGLGEFAPEVGRCAATIACYKLSLSPDSDDVLKYAELAEKVLKYNFQPGRETDIRLYNYALADALKSLAVVYTRKSSFQKSEVALKKALSITYEVFGDSHLRIARLLLDLGRLYVLWHKNQDAVETLEKAEKIYKIFRKPDSFVFTEISHLKVRALSSGMSSSPISAHDNENLLD